MQPMAVKSSAPEYGLPASVQRRKSLLKKVFALGLALLGSAAVLRSRQPMSAAMKAAALQQRAESSAPHLKIATWNVAAINNNPFEYWITIAEGSKYKQSYDGLMVAVEKFLENPEANDVPVDQVFTEAMFEQLMGRVMKETDWPAADLQKVRKYWRTDYSQRKIVTEFLKDATLGSKRLASMPDRVTNTVGVVGGESVFRPTVINMYEGDLGSTEKWFDQWSTFFFDTTLPIMDGGKVMKRKGYELLQPIKRSKYPAVTEEEEAISLPLQLVCQAIFDAIMVHMMNSVAEAKDWQELKMEIVSALNKKKVEHTLAILQKTYVDADVIALQEVSSSLIDDAVKRLGDTHHVVAPAEIDAVRDQNSVLLLKKTTFPKGAHREITQGVQDSFPPNVSVPVAKGDILAVQAKDRHGLPYVLASFHGDTNGLATIPVFDALVAYLQSDPALAHSTLVFGLDANTYVKGKVVDGKKKTQDNMEFRADILNKGFSHCWGNTPPVDAITTFNSRTFLQPQLNKACKSTEKRANGDINPKDFIIFDGGDFAVDRTWKDNTGEEKYVEDMAFPTLTFPSDHGILGTVLSPVPQTRHNKLRK